MDFKPFDSFSRQLRDIKGKIQGAAATLEQKKRERDWITESPPPKSDVIKMYHAMIDDRANLHNGRVLKYDMNEPRWKGWSQGRVPPILESNGGHTLGSGHAHVNALYAVLAPALKTYINDLVGSVKWPKKVGPPMADRPALIQKLDAEISKLEADISKANDILNRKG